MSRLFDQVGEMFERAQGGGVGQVRRITKVRKKPSKLVLSSWLGWLELSTFISSPGNALRAPPVLPLTMKFSVYICI